MFGQDNSWRLHSRCPKCEGDIWYNWDLDKFWYRRNGNDGDCLCIVPICQQCGELETKGEFLNEQWICEKCIYKGSFMKIEEAIQHVLAMEQGEGTARISCHFEIEQNGQGVECRRVFEIQKKSGLCFIGPTLESALLNSRMEDDDFGSRDIFKVNLNHINSQFNEFSQLKMVA